uniref:Sperm acrosome membrane-associated protein 3 n=1 Tax=Felis catus TaxID=9685 RepID=A0ABI7YDL6_FELCA
MMAFVFWKDNWWQQRQWRRVTFCDWTARAVELSAISKPSCEPAWQGLCMEARSWAPRRQLCPPGIMLLAFATLLSCLLTSGQAKVYSRCELARALQDFGMEGYRGYSMADWVCLAYFTSGFNTAAVDHEADGSTNNGIFQISSRKWCKNLSTDVPNWCQMYCSGRVGPELGAAWGQASAPAFASFLGWFAPLAFISEWESEWETPWASQGEWDGASDEYGSSMNLIWGPRWETVLRDIGMWGGE